MTCRVTTGGRRRRSRRTIQACEINGNYCWSYVDYMACTDQIMESTVTVNRQIQQRTACIEQGLENQPRRGQDSPNQDNYDSLKDAKIMMVDDEPIMMDIIQAFLEDEGYRQFITVEHSTEAMKILADSKPDILLLDLVMPEIDGFEILSTVRNNDDFKYLPIIILTSSSDAASKLKALELGATDFLAKPVDSSELALRLRNTLAAKAYQDKLAYYDSLTGLPNRKLFLDRLDWSLKQAKRNGELLTVMDIGLDRFRQITDTLGPKTGDELLRIVAKRLTAVTRETDVFTRTSGHEIWRDVARLSGDEFALLLPGVVSADNATFVANRMLQALKAPFDVFGNEVFITGGIGIAIYPDDGDQTDLLLKHASAAKDYAKQQGPDNYQFFSREMNARSRQRLSLETKLRRALELQQLEVFYQPKVMAQTGKIMGMECLLRWFHPEDGMISPVEFIPVAEESGLIVPIGEWILNEACQRTQEWIAAGHQPLKVSVNVSGQQFADAGFKAAVQRALQSSGLDPACLMLEMTESMMMGDAENNIRLLHEIKELGVSFSIDDFGTGYSSLSYLKKFPIDELKIDRAFLIDVPTNPDDVSIVKAILAMAHSLDLSVVAEGVEEQAQLTFLQQWNCEVIQGFYFSRPLNHQDFSAYLTRD